jgi:hypothetical protein
MASLDRREMWQLSHLTKSKNGKKISHVSKRNVFLRKITRSSDTEPVQKVQVCIRGWNSGESPC